VDLDAHVNEFGVLGVTRLRGLFTDYVDSLREGIERNIRHPGPYFRHYTPEGASGHFFGDYCNWQRIPEYRDFIERSAAAEVAAALMASDTARIFHEHVLVKEPGTGERTPWHHDQPYYSVDGMQNCSLWLALDPVDAIAGMEFIAGSHHWGRWFTPRRFTGQDFERDEDGLEPIPDFDAERGRHTILAFDVQPGDALAFHFLTVHAANANPSASRRRRGFSTRWLGDDAVWAVRSGDMSPPFPEAHQRLRPGDPVEGPEFPVIWRR